MDRKIIDKIGWFGGLLLAFCGAPEAYFALRDGYSDLSYPFLLMWLFGEIMLFWYSFVKNRETSLLPLLYNYGFNILFIGIILSVKLLFIYL